MRIIFGLVLLALSVVASCLFSLKYRERFEFYTGFSEFNRLMKNAVSFSSESVGGVLKNRMGIFYDCFNGYKAGAGENFQLPKFLTDEERSSFCNYVKEIGLTDKITQLDFIGEYENLLSVKLSSAEAEYKKYKPLFIKLGFLFGLILFILAL